MTYSRYQSIGKGLASSAQLTENGQILVSLDLKKKLPELPSDHATPVREFAIDRAASDQAPPMSIVIMIVGSRGDVQPYIALGNRLKEHGHRVRIATHETFRKMVKDAGLEFQSIGGDPAELMSYMVRNPGLLPGTESLLNGDIPKKRKMLTEVVPSNIFKSSNAEGGLSNYLSYATADLIQWQGIGDLINSFRTKTLGLDALSIRSGPSLADRLKVPWTYCFSPTLIPKPKDWMNHIDVVGFYFLEGAKNFKPEKDLEDFLAAGPPPVYIGFGSVVVEDATAMTPVLGRDGAQSWGRARTDSAEETQSREARGESKKRSKSYGRKNPRRDPQRVAVWWSQEHYLRLSAFAAQILVDAKVIKYENLLPHRMSQKIEVSMDGNLNGRRSIGPKEFDTRKKIQDPITGGLGALFWTLTHLNMGVAEIFYKKTGIISAATAFPRGMVKLVDSVQEGFQNVPAMYGTNIRRVGKIHDWKSGFMEGGKVGTPCSRRDRVADLCASHKSFLYGWYDGITGLVTEPIKGHEQEGMLGALKGTGRGIMNTTMLPAAGSLALVTHPTRGMWHSVRSKWAKHPELQVIVARRWEGQQAVKNCPDVEQQRDAIVQAFELAKKTTTERKAEFKRQATLFLQDTSDPSKLEAMADLNSEIAEAQPAPLLRTVSENPTPHITPPPLPPRNVVSQNDMSQVYVEEPPEYDEALYQRDIEEAIRLSLLDLEEEHNPSAKGKEVEMEAPGEQNLKRGY
ncbi:hypothetical protein FRC00_003165 [Tulasnella sp. 408]|nr:hypothetical protein FRC00_003165 [Tulasnella sp. 408]